MFFKIIIKCFIFVVLMVQCEKVDGKCVVVFKGFMVKKNKCDFIENVNVCFIVEIVKEVEKVIGVVLVYFIFFINIVIKVGYVGWEFEKIVENIIVVVKELVERFVLQKWSNVCSFYVKGLEMVVFFVYQMDELWLDESKVVFNGQEGFSVFFGKREQKFIKGEKFNIGKKCKLLDVEFELVVEEVLVVKEDRLKKKVKKVLLESNDEKFDKEIVERKVRLKKQKVLVKKVVEV